MNIQNIETEKIEENAIFAMENLLQERSFEIVYIEIIEHFLRFKDFKLIVWLTDRYAISSYIRYTAEVDIINLKWCLVKFDYKGFMLLEPHFRSKNISQKVSTLSISEGSLDEILKKFKNL